MSPLHPGALPFDGAADVYERTRPSFSPETLSLLVDALGIVPGRRVVDLGAGTGKLTRLLVGTGADLTAVEPLDGMRRQLRLAVPSARVVAGTAEQLPLRTASIEAVTAAQAFHWFDVSEAAPEIHRVLRPGGRLGLVWNQRDERVDWVRRLGEIIHTYENYAPSERLEAWRSPLEASRLFTALEHRTLTHAEDHDPEGLVERVASISYVAGLPDDDRLAVLHEVRRLALGLGPRFTLPYRVEIYWCSKPS